MADKPEQLARAEIDRLLQAAGWSVQDFKSANIHATRGVAPREFRLTLIFAKDDSRVALGAQFLRGYVECNSTATA